MSEELMNDGAMNVKVDVPAVVFTNRRLFIHFEVEYAKDGDDLVFHFFKPAQNYGESFWEEDFPLVLSPVAEHTFNATYPRLRAARTQLGSRDPSEPPLDSWWMKASGFGISPDPDGLAVHFCVRLEQALESRLGSRG